MYVGGPGKKNPVSEVSKSDSSSSTLQGATTIHNVPPGQVHQKKVVSPGTANPVLKAALSDFMQARQKVSEQSEGLGNQCTQFFNSPSMKEQVKREKTLAKLKEMIAAHEEAIGKYDHAISQIKNISHTVAFQGQAVEGGVAKMFTSLGLTASNSMQLVGKLREIRAEAYDDLQRARALHAYHSGVHALHAANTAAEKLEKLKEAKAADQTNMTPEQLQEMENELKNEKLTLNVQPKIYAKNRDGAVSQFDTCIDILAPMPLDGVKLPDSHRADFVFVSTLTVALSMRKAAFNEDMKRDFDDVHGKAKKTCERLDSGWSKLQTDEERRSCLGKLAQQGMKLKRVGIEALKYAERTVELCDQALTGNLDVSQARKAELAADKKKMQEESTRLVTDMFEMQRKELPLMLKALPGDYDAGLLDSCTRAQSMVEQVKVIHDCCTQTIGAGTKAGVPEHLLHRALETLPAGYEDALRQFQYLANRFEKKGTGDVISNLIAQEMKFLSDLIESMAELAESQAGQVESDGKAGQGTDVDLKAWIDITLREKFPKLYQTDDEVDDLTEDMADFDLAETADEVQGTSTAAGAQGKATPIKGPTPSQNDPIKELTKTIAAAENALNNEKTQEDLVRLAKDIDKHSRNARQGAEDGASPCTVEDYMKLAAQAEMNLAERKTRIVKKFEKALSKMEASHPKYQEFKKTIATLTDQAGQHKATYADLLKEGEDLRIGISKTLPPTHSLFNYLYDKGQVQSVTRKPRIELESLDKDGKSRINARTGGPIKDFIDEYIVKYKGGKEVAVHCHYKSMNANDMDIVACHFKLMDQKGKGLQYVIQQAKEGKDIEIHRGRTNRETVVKLQKMTGNKTS